MDKKPTFLNYLLPVVMVTIGLLHYVKHGVDAAAILPVILGVFALYMALFNHLLLEHTLAFLEKVWHPIGQTITLILLTVTFFVIFVPVGLLLRLLKKDI